MVAAKKNQKDSKGREGLARRASGLLSKPVTAVTTGALERALLAEFPAADAEPWDRTGMSVGRSGAPDHGCGRRARPDGRSYRGGCEHGCERAGHSIIRRSSRRPPPSCRPASVAANPGAGVWRAVERGVSILSYHTALDVSVRAQRVLPGMLSLTFQQVLDPIPGSREKGYGQLCTLGEDDGLTLGQLAARCTSVFGRAPRVWGDFPRELDRVVTCTGSAGDLGRACLRAQVDCLVCGEIKYHDALELSQAGLAVVDLGHDTSELPLAAVLAAAVENAGIPGDLVTVLDQGDNWSYPETVRV